MAVNARNRDIVFDFRGSCNCCDRRPPLDTVVYVNGKGEVKKFSNRKAAKDPEMAIRHAVENMQTLVGQIAERNGVSSHEIIERLKSEHGIDLREAKPVTLRTVEAVNGAVWEIIETPKTPSNGADSEFNLRV